MSGEIAIRAKNIVFRRGFTRWEIKEYKQNIVANELGPIQKICSSSNCKHEHCFEVTASQISSIRFWEDFEKLPSLAVLRGIEKALSKHPECLSSSSSTSPLEGQQKYVAVKWPGLKGNYVYYYLAAPITNCKLSYS